MRRLAQLVWRKVSVAPARRVRESMFRGLRRVTVLLVCCLYSVVPPQHARAVVGGIVYHGVSLPRGSDVFATGAGGDVPTNLTASAVAVEIMPFVSLDGARIGISGPLGTLRTGPTRRSPT